jgi:benzoyl-CoA reductase/2-hydroxyglutaryl-CoA dehydratase subunit BcrC/BadD/HgdB
MKLTLIGAGGFRTPVIYRALAAGEVETRYDDVAFYDIDQARLDRIGCVMDGISEELGSSVPVTMTTNLEAAVDGADIVYCAVRAGGIAGRILDETAALAQGVIGQETTGPGGITFALRTVPVVTEIAEVVARRAPDATFVNFSNPVGLVTEAARRVLAAGAIGVGLCGGSQFWIEDGEKVLPRNICPLVKAIVGAKVGGTCPYFQSCDMLTGETTCDGKKKAWEILSEYAPVHVMDLPQMKRDKDYKKWAEEISDYKAKLEGLTGNEITEEKLADAIKLCNRKRAALQRLYNARKALNVPISGKDALLVSQIAFYDNPERFIEMTNKLCDELENRIKEGIGVASEKSPRIMITGTPMAIPNWKMHHLIEESGAVVVCEETCTGTRYFEKEVDETQTTMEGMIKALADRYLNINCACFTPNCTDPGSCLTRQECHPDWSLEQT